MNWKISSKSQILILSAVGVSHTIMELYSSTPNIFEEIWQMELAESFKPYQNIIKTVISGMILVRGLTGHLYIALYFLILYPVIMERLRSVLLLWMFLSAIRSILMNIGVTLIGLALCSLIPQMNTSCMEFVAWQAFEFGCSVYMWTVVNDYYHSLKRRAATRNRLQSPHSSTCSTDETSSLLLSEEWSLPASLVEEFQRSTKENINETRTNVASDSTKNTSSSVDSLLAQAMIEWFMKKIIKIKPKSQNKDFPDAKISTIKTSDVTTLRERLKKSIAAIDQDDLKDLVVPDIAKSNLVSPSTEGSISMSKNISADAECNIRTPAQIISTIPDTVTLRNKNIDKPDESENSPDANRLQTVNINYLTSTELFENNFKSINDCNQDQSKIEPTSAINLVKELFPEDILVQIRDGKFNAGKNKSKIVYKKRLHMFYNSKKGMGVESKEVNNENNSQIKDEKSKILFTKKTVMTHKENTLNKDRRLTARESADTSSHQNERNYACYNFDLNKIALDCSTAIVQSLLDGIVDNASKRIGVLEMSNLHDKLFTRLAPLKEINVKETNGNQSNDLINTHGRDNDISLKNYDNLVKKESKCKYSVPERLKCVNNKDRVSRMTDKSWKLKKPYNKENECDDKYRNILANNDVSVKALRYHYRRINQNKIPIRKHKDNILSRNSIKTILDDMRFKENKKSIIDDTKNSSNKLSIFCNLTGINRSQEMHGINEKLKLINLIKDKSSQTVTTDKFQHKINEITK